MKKLSIFIALMLVALAASAQSGREKGFVFRPEVGLGLYSVGTFENVCSINTFTAPGFGKENTTVFLKNEGTDGAAYNLMANFGYNFSPYVFLGGGVGFYGGSGASVALYANPRFYLGDRKATFFFDLKSGYLLGLSGKSMDNDAYYLKHDLFDKTNYYWDGNAFHTTEDYNDFVTIKENALCAKGYFVSFGFGVEVNRSSFGMAIDLYNMNLETTIENHYWSYADNEVHGAEEAPTVHHTDVVKYDDSNQLGYSITFKYGYSIF